MDESNAFLLEVIDAPVCVSRKLRSKKNNLMKTRLREILVCVIGGDEKGSVYHEHSELSSGEDQADTLESYRTLSYVNLK